MKFGLHDGGEGDGHNGFGFVKMSKTLATRDAFFVGTISFHRVPEKICIYTNERMRLTEANVPHMLGCMLGKVIIENSDLLCCSPNLTYMVLCYAMSLQCM